ncbi:hypothetical protein [Brevibacillus massiliensis]|uniref:hypothetical protein n=1 Tax=Brevibacillus massiliensis TaxID=1118054 RepID=UPI00031A4193|nr:hypothetical protein [Brevibacillus massiliensis]
MIRLNGNDLRYHFGGVRGKMGQIRQLVEVLDTMFDSFHQVNEIGKSMLGQPRSRRVAEELDFDQRRKRRLKT